MNSAVAWYWIIWLSLSSEHFISLVLSFMFQEILNFSFTWINHKMLLPVTAISNCVVYAQRQMRFGHQSSLGGSIIQCGFCSQNVKDHEADPTKTYLLWMTCQWCWFSATKARLRPWATINFLNESFHLSECASEVLLFHTSVVSCWSAVSFYLSVPY